MTVPALSDIVSGRVSVSALRAIELDDLLGRDPVSSTTPACTRFLDGRTVLVTGAGGSIGSELCRQIARFAPGAHRAVRELRVRAVRHRAGIPRPPAGAAGRRRDRRRQGRARAWARCSTRYRPQVVFHAAAYKHVPLMEDDNAFEAVAQQRAEHRRGGARRRQRAGAEKFVLVSTDKAVNPANVMGASKRLAELVCQALQPGERARSSSSCASATCSAPPAAWCRGSASRSRAAGRSP